MNEKLTKAYQKIEQQRLSLIAEISPYSHASINQAPAPGKWSVVQILTHLQLVEQGSLNYWAKKLQAPEAIPPVPLSSRIKFGIFIAYYSLGLSWISFKSPKFAAIVPESAELNELDAHWKQLRVELKKVAENTPQEVLDKGMMRHGVVGRINMAMTLSFYLTHVQHHRKQIQRILKKAEKIQTSEGVKLPSK